MQDFSRWLRPTLLGPLLTLWTLTTLGAATLGMATISGGRLDSWALGMAWATFFGSTLGVTLIAADVLLLRAKMRRLPTGARAWISAILSPFGVSMVLGLPFLPMPESILGLVALVFAAMLGGCAGLRLLFGTRPTA